MFRFTIHELVLAVALVGVSAGWALDRFWLQRKLAGPASPTPVASVNTPPCPVCGATDGKRIMTLSERSDMYSFQCSCGQLFSIPKQFLDPSLHNAPAYPFSSPPLSVPRPTILPPAGRPPIRIIPENEERLPNTMPQVPRPADLKPKDATNTPSFSSPPTKVRIAPGGVPQGTFPGFDNSR